MKSEHVTLIGRDIHTDAADGGAEGATGLPVFLLRVLSGPEKGLMLALDWTRTSRVLVGTGPRADLALTDPRVSRRHLSLSPEGPRLRLRDLGSRNGTAVNDINVAEAWISGGETISLGETTLRVTNTGARAEVAARHNDNFGRMLGRSAAMQRLFAWGERAAASTEPLVIEGEPGTGKDLFAEAIHDAHAGTHAGSRGERPFVLVSTETLRMATISQLMTDARGGTLLVSDPEELEPAMQKALAAELAGWRAGGRVIATTRRDLDRECDSGRLTPSLFTALSGDVVHMPPLRQRHGDVELLAQHFFAQGGAPDGLTESVLAGFLDYEWPGNVRELRDAIDRVILGEGGEHEPLPRAEEHTGAISRDVIDDILSRNPTLSQARAELVGELEQRFVRDALAKHHGNVTRAAAASGLTRRYFHILRKKR